MLRQCSHNFRTSCITAEKLLAILEIPDVAPSFEFVGSCRDGANKNTKIKIVAIRFIIVVYTLLTYCGLNFQHATYNLKIKANGNDMLVVMDKQEILPWYIQGDSIIIFCNQYKTA